MPQPRWSPGTPGPICRSVVLYSVVVLYSAVVLYCMLLRRQPASSCARAGSSGREPRRAGHLIA